MKVHHLNCATLCPFGRRLINGEGGLFSAARMVCHCLLIETPDGLALIDGGLGSEDIRNPKGRLSTFFRTMTTPKLDPKETALHQITQLGFKAEDVRHIIPTHLDPDHAGALSDFPQAKVHILEKEYASATDPKTMVERIRYSQNQWSHHPQWVKHKVEGERWFGFEAVRQVQELPPEILIIPLHGHTSGHSAIAVQSEGKWLLHAGDAYFFHGEMDPNHPWCPVGLRLFQNIMQADRDARVRNVERLRQFAKEKSSEVQVFCSHDCSEFDRLLHRT